ncbi:hypothetical protein D3C78_806470 [compost metagenome]
MIAPWFRNHHHGYLCQGASAQIKKLKGIIEHCSVRSIRVYNRFDLAQIFAEHFTLEQRLASMHPVHISAQGIDLTIVDHKAVGMRTFPAWEGIRTETGVN